MGVASLDLQQTDVGQGMIDYGRIINKPKINGVTLEGNLSTEDINIFIPQRVSELQNDAGYITKNVNDLVYYYDKTEVDNMISTIPKFDIKVVDALPTEDISPTTIYLLMVPGEDHFEEYIYVDDEWDKLGDGNIDLSDYATYEYVDAELAEKVDAADLATVALSGRYSDLIGTPTNLSQFTNDTGFITAAALPTKTSDLTNDGEDGTSTYVESNELATVATSGSYNDLTDKPTIDFELVEMSYGESNAWAKFIAAYRGHKIVYCRASSNSNPGTGSQTRKAFMAYVNNAENPTEVEFQYVRSVSSKTASQPVDQVFVYKLTNASGGTWTVQARDMGPKLAQGTNTTVSYSNGTYTISAAQPTVNDATLTIQKNGTTVETFTANSSTNKTANIVVPTKTSDITNDSDFVNSTQVGTALAAYTYPSQDLYTQSDIDTMLAQISSLKIEVVNALPQAGNADTIYLLRVRQQGNDLYQEYFWVNNAWELIGGIDLTDYYTKTEVNTLLTAKADVSAIPTKTSDLTNDSNFAVDANYVHTDNNYTTAEKNKLAGIAAGAEVNVQSNWTQTNSSADDFIKNKPSIPTKTSDLTNDSGFITTAAIPTNVSAFTNDAGYLDEIPDDSVGLNQLDSTIVNALNNINNKANTADLAAVAFSGDYDDLTDKPAIPTKTSDLTNDSGFLNSIPIASSSVLGGIKVGSGLSISSGGVLSANGGGTADDVAWGHITGTMADQTDLTDALAAKANSSDLATVATSGSYNDLSDKPTIPTVNNATLTIQRNSTSVGTFTANASSNKTINITVPTTAADVSALPASTKYGASIEVSVNTTNYKVTTTLKDQDGNTLGTAQVIDLPLESVVVNGSYDSTNKKIVLTLQNGNTIDIPVGDLIAGLQTEITSTNKLSSDLVDDTNHTHKFVTAAQITKLNGIAAGAEVNQNAFSNIKVGTTTVAADAKTDTLELVAGSNVTITPDVTNDKVTIASTNTTYDDATTTTHGLMTAADKVKLNGIATGAEVNVQSDWSQTTTTADDYIKNKPSIPTKTSDLTNDSNFVSDASYVHTDNNYTTAEKNKLSGIAAGAEVNVQANWTQTTTTADDYIKNKPTLATVATSGSYNDLSNKPTIPAAQVNSDWNATSGKAQILNKPTLATVATSGSYNDLSNKPTIPTVNNATLTIQKNGTTVKTFTANASTNVTANITVPTKTSDITNDSNFVASGDLATVATSGSYNDLSNKPTIPTVNNGQLTIQKNGSNVATFTANQSGNATANITVPTKTSDITNDSDFTTTDVAQEFAIGQGSTNPVFDDMTPVKTIEWDVSDATYRPIYQMANTGWTYVNMDVTVAYRITVTGTNINSVTDVVDRWINPISYPITSMMCRTLSVSAGTTGLRYLRAVYPVSGYLNNTTYPLGTEIAMYNATARHVKVEVFKDNSKVTWNTTKPSAPIYVSGTYNGYNTLSAYDTRGWRFRQPSQMYAQNAGYASYIADFEAVNTAAGELKAGATALVGGHYAYLADDGLVYDISNKTKNIAMGESKVGFINGAVSANTAIGWTVWRAISRPNATQFGYFQHDTMALGDRVFLRCTMDSSGNVHSDNYLSKTMSAGYTWMPFGWARSATTLYVDTRFPMFYTLDSNGKLTHINGKQINAGSSITVDSALSTTSTNPVQNKVITAELNSKAGTSDMSTALAAKQDRLTAGAHINITGGTIKAVDYVHSEQPVSTTAVTPVVTNNMIADGTITADKLATGATLKLTLSTSDIGEGAALAANTLYGVYQ